MNNLFKYIKNIFTPTYEVTVVRCDKYVSVSDKIISKKELHNLGIRKTWTKEPIYIEDKNVYMRVETFEFDIIKGTMYLIKNISNNTIRVATCISVDKIGTFPPLFDGSETIGIGYEILGMVVE